MILLWACKELGDLSKVSRTYIEVLGDVYLLTKWMVSDGLEHMEVSQNFLGRSFLIESSC